MATKYFTSKTLQNKIRVKRAYSFSWLPPPPLHVSARFYEHPPPPEVITYYLNDPIVFMTNKRT